MRGEPQPHLLERIARMVARLMGREPKPVPAYVYARARRQPIDRHRETRY